MNMPISQNLMTALLSMDSYNRGYGAGIILTGSQLGNAVLGLASTDASANIIGGQAAGFFAQSYTWNGKTIISYRGTNADSIDAAAADIMNGWATGLGFASPQSAMAEFR
jgi:hypothetical protein